MRIYRGIYNKIIILKYLRVGHDVTRLISRFQTILGEGCRENLKINLFMRFLYWKNHLNVNISRNIQLNPYNDISTGRARRHASYIKVSDHSRRGLSRKSKNKLLYAIFILEKSFKCAYLQEYT